MSHTGDVDEIARQFQERYGLMLAVARRYAPTPDSVYDIVQQVFIEFVRCSVQGKLDSERDVTPLLHQITKIQAIKYAAEWKRHSPQTLQTIAQELAGNAETVEPEYALEELTLLRRCLEKLPPQSRELIERHYKQGVSLEEIARQSERKAVSLRSIFCRIRQKLRECIERNKRSEE